MKRKVPWRIVLGSVLALLVIAGVFGMRLCGDGETLRETTLTIEPGGVGGGTIESEKAFAYSFSATPTGGPIQIGFGGIEGEDPTKQEFDRIFRGGKPVEAGVTVTLTGQSEAGRYSWAIFNPDPKRSVKVRIRFHAK